MSKPKYLLLVISFLCLKTPAQTLNSWIQVANFSGTPRTNAVAFNIDSFGYVGCFGFYQPDTFPYPINQPNDLWQYNPSTNIWIQKANFPGTSRESGICFTIGSSAYVGLGYNDIGVNMCETDFWEYNSLTDTWIQKADFGGGPRNGAIGFSIGNKGYVGLGSSDTSNDKKDFWEYDPVSDTWTQLADFAGEPRSNALGFSILDKGYIGLGFNTDTGYGTYLKDFWQYDPASAIWTKMTDFIAEPRISSFCFSIGSMGYIGTGIDTVQLTTINQFWEYNSLSDAWVQKDSFGGGVRGGAAGFSIGGKGFAGIGSVLLNHSSGPVTYHADFWMYTPDSISTGIKNIYSSNISIYPDPANDKISINNLPPSSTLTISDMTGRVFTTTLSGQHIDVSALPAGVYCLHIQDSGGSVVRKFVKE